MTRSPEFIGLAGFSGEKRRPLPASGRPILTAIYVTHDQKEALSVGDRIAVMEGGHIRLVGAPAEVYRQPVTRFVADFIGGTVSGIAADSVAVRTPLGDFSATAHGWQPEAGRKVVLSPRSPPKSLRLRKKVLDANARKRAAKVVGAA